MPKKVLYEKNNFVLFNNCKLTCLNNSLDKYQMWNLYLLLDNYFEDLKEPSKYEIIINELEKDIVEKEDTIEELEDTIEELEDKIWELESYTD